LLWAENEFFRGDYQIKLYALLTIVLRTYLNYQKSRFLFAFMSAKSVSRLAANDKPSPAATPLFCPAFAPGSGGGAVWWFAFACANARLGAVYQPKTPKFGEKTIFAPTGATNKADERRIGIATVCWCTWQRKRLIWATRVSLHRCGTR
jgi:hypothetical protein